MLAPTKHAMGYDTGEMYRLYWIPGTCARVIYVALQEVEAPYEVVLVDRLGGSPSEYLEVNPKGKVPALQVGARVITENPAIQTFLSRRHPEAGLLPTEGQAGIEALETVSWFAAGIHRFITPLRFPRRFCDLEQAWPSVRAAARAELERAFTIVELRLAGRDWILNDWSLADVHLLWLWFRATGSGMDGSQFPRCIAHAARCEARPSVAFVLDREEEEFARLQAAGLAPPHVPDFQVGRAPRYSTA
jgi:glutathione S-transferase